MPKFKVKFQELYTMTHIVEAAITHVTLKILKMRTTSPLIFLIALTLFACDIYASDDSQKATRGHVAYDADADIACFKSYSGITPNQPFEATMNICLKAAQSGAQGSQTFIGVMYLVQGQKEKAVYWLKEAASRG